MKRKLLALCLVLTISFGALGVGFALWSDTLTINSIVYTGELNVEWSVGTSYDSEPPDKDVSSISCWVDSSDPNILHVELTDAYPCIDYYQDVDIHNLGSVPVILTGITFNAPPGVLVEMLWDDNPATTDIYEGTQLHTGEIAVGTIHVHLDNTVSNIAQTFTFDGTVTAVQYNEYAGVPGMPGSQNLVLYLPMNEGSGTTAHDLSGYANDGTIHGATWVVENGHNVLTFDGDDYVVVTSDPSLDITGDLTVEFWSKYVAGASDNYRVISKPMDSGDSSWGIVLYHGDGGSMTWYYNNKYARDSVTPTAGVWHHFVGVFDSAAGQLRIYQDGSLVATKTGVSAQATNDGNLYIGWGRLGSYYYVGSIAGIRMYNQALSAGDIMAHYSAEASQYP